MDDLQTILKLKKKLNEAVEQGKEEGSVLKVLHRLSQVSMTIELLQSTQIGRDVNALRKMSNTIKTESKALVQKWKRLLPPAEAGHPPQPKPTNERHTHAQTGDDDVTLLHGTKPHKSSSKSRSRSKASSSKESKSLDDFSKALMGMPETLSNNDTMDCLETDFPAIATHSHRVAHRSKDSLEPPESITKQRSMSPRPVPHEVHNGQLVSLALPSYSSTSPQTNHKKRKADVAGSTDIVALSKKSRTQVYSGKKAVSGPQFVTPLFDLCIKVLIDNIDDIEEVGGIPFYVLEPVLSRSTATQLMRLEEYNPHFTEDSDGLWEKHCRKEFKGALPKGHQTWKELYTDRLEDREMKLRSLTARISATEKARKDPIRKVISTVATRKPGRRGASSVAFFPVKSGSSSLDQKVKARPLMKATMKMAKQRNSMMRFKPSQR